MTKAVSAQGEVLYVEETPGNWVKIQELKSVPEIGEQPEKIDATTLESECKEYIKDIPDQAELEFTFNAMPVHVANSNVTLLTGLSSSNSYRWKWISPRLGRQVVWEGDFSYRYGAGEVSTVKDIILTIIPRTRPIETDITSTWTVTYNSNGGTGTMTDPSSPYSNGGSVTVLSNTFTAPEGKSFSTFNTRPDATGVSYSPSSVFQIYDNITLYAIWS